MNKLAIVNTLTMLGILHNLFLEVINSITVRNILGEVVKSVSVSSLSDVIDLRKEERGRASTRRVTTHRTAARALKKRCGRRKSGT